MPLPSVQISLVSALVPQETKPTPQIQRAPAAPKPPATMPATPATPQVATNTAAEESPPAAESIESTPSVVPDEITQPLYNAAYLNNPPPTYPLAARRRGLEGTVVVRAQILEDGKCHQANLSKSSGHEMLDQAALAAVRSWHFAPAKRGTQTISAWVEVPITFRLTTQNEQIQSL